MVPTTVQRHLAILGDFRPTLVAEYFLCEIYGTASKAEPGVFAFAEAALLCYGEHGLKFGDFGILLKAPVAELPLVRSFPIMITVISCNNFKRRVLRQTVRKTHDVFPCWSWSP